MISILLRNGLYSQQLTTAARQNIFKRSLAVYRPIKLALPANRLNAATQVNLISTTRTLQTSDLTTKAEMEKAMNNVEDLFSAAKDEMEYAEESHGSVYYHDDRATAKKAVDECLDAYDSFLKDLPTDDMRQEVQGKVGMKLKELKMAFDALPTEDH